MNKLSANLVKTEYMIIASANKLKSVNYTPLITLSKIPIKPVHRTDYIGLVIDEKLSWEEYIKSLCKKISSAVTAIRRVNYLPQNTLITLYHSLVESRFRYCSTVWGNCNKSLKANLQRIQNRAARIITRTKYSSVDSEALLRKLGWLNVQQLIDFNTAVMVHKSINKTAPSYQSVLPSPALYIATILELPTVQFFRLTPIPNLDKKVLRSTEVVYGTSWIGRFKK